MGGRRAASLVNLARPDDPTALFHNPAGLADQPGLTLHTSGALFILGTRYRLKALDSTLYPEINPAGCGQEPPCPWPLDAQGYYANEIRPESTIGAVPYLGVSSDLGFLGKKNVVLSAAAYLPAFYGGSMSEHAPTRYHFVSGSFLVGAATVGGGWRINRYLAVGASVSYLLMRMTFKKNLSIVASSTNPGEQPAPEVEAAQLLLGDLTAEYRATDHGFGWGGAVLVTPLRWLAFGVNYGGSTPARFNGELTLIPSRNPDYLPTLLNASKSKLPRWLEVEMAVPHTLQLGASVTPLSWLEVGSDLRMWFYQLIESMPLVPIYDPAEPGTPAIDEDALTEDPFYRLSYELAFGAVVRPLKRMPNLELMVGFSYDRSPIPDPTFNLSNPSMSSVNFACGVRWAATPRLRVTASYTQYRYLGRNVVNSITSPPTNGTGTGVAHLPGLELQYTFGLGASGSSTTTTGPR
jgi:long-subunit fatty acid transport protein